MAHHKRRRPKHQRSGCLLCKSFKDEREPKTTDGGNLRRLLSAEDEIREYEWRDSKED